MEQCCQEPSAPNQQGPKLRILHRCPLLWPRAWLLHEAFQPLPLSRSWDHPLQQGRCCQQLQQHGRAPLQLRVLLQ